MSPPGVCKDDHLTVNKCIRGKKFSDYEHVGVYCYISAQYKNVKCGLF
jgi:hypothetical protein